jgi:diguanylate cyclase (GGDEF)-like protein
MEEARRSRLLFALGVTGVAYVLAFVPLYHVFGIEAAAPSVLLVAGVGWLWGLRAGVFAGVLTLPLHLLLLLNLAGVMVWDLLGFLVCALILAGIGGTVGRMRESTRELTHQALHDPLTGLPNRVLFSDRLEHALARAARRKEPIAVLFLDLDNFKVVNDDLGHKAGDSLLILVTKRLRSCLRSEDTLARFGGDEFTILLEDMTSVSDATQAAERIAEELRAPFFLEGREVFVTASIGISLSTFSVSGRDQPEDLLRDADAAMYRVKANGKAGYEVFDPSMYSMALERLKLENDLRRAVERGEFRIYYQPEVQLKTSRVFAMEALVRWKHPEQGLVLPSEFIPIAEETGLIIPVGRWMIKESCRQAHRWHDKYPDSPPLEVSVNLSAKQFQHPGLAEDVARNLRETGLEPATLVLEITESVLMEDAPHTIAMLEKLKSLGVKLAIDDFGTGYSSLSYLKHFPVDYLKIDCSIVEDLEQDPKNEAIVSAAITLAHALGAQAVAEGVETSEQLRRVRELGGDAGQGYYFCEPRSSEAAIASFLET